MTDVLISWNRHFLFGFAFPADNASAKTTIHGLTECLTHHHGIPHSIASDRGTHFTAKEVWQWAHVQEFTGVILGPVVRSSWLDKTVDWPFKDPVPAAAGW